MYRIVVDDRRTEVRDERGEAVFSAANRVFWEPARPGLAFWRSAQRPHRFVAAGDPDEWLPNIGLLGPTTVETRLVDDARESPVALKEMWVAFLVYCETAAIKRSPAAGWLTAVRRRLATNTVVLRLSDSRLRSFVAATITETRIRQWKLVHE